MSAYGRTPRQLDRMIGLTELMAGSHLPAVPVAVAGLAAGSLRFREFQALAGAASWIGTAAAGTRPRHAIQPALPGPAGFRNNPTKKAGAMPASLLFRRLEPVSRCPS